MPLRPGTQIILRSSPTPRSAPTDTGVGFMIGLADKGSITAPFLCQSLDDFIKLGGTRQSYSVLYDAVEAFFREGGQRVWISRVVGPAPVYATRNLVDNVAAISLVAKANSPGAWGNAIKVGVVAGVASGFAIQVTDANNVVLEQSPDLATQADAVAWSLYSQYITLTLGASALVPVIAGANVITLLTTGTDDRTNITNAQYQAALDRIPKDLGPGNIAVPGNATSAIQLMVLAHAAANNRVAILDATDTPTIATLTALAVADKAGLNGQYGGLFWPWVVSPGVVAGTTRTIPPSAFVMGKMAAVDASDGPNIPAAGDKGILRFAVGLSQPLVTDAVRDQLNTAGVDVIRPMYGQFRIFGYRTLADPINNPDWLNLGNVRLIMSIVAEADVIAQQFVFDQIDGQGRTIGAYGGALIAMLQRYYNTGQLYGASAADAFNVDVGATVNTAARIAAGELRAVVAIRPSPDAELVTVEIVNVPVTKAVA